MRRLSEGIRGLLPVKLLFGLLWIVIVATPTALAQERDWQPQRTWVFVVGTLQWKDKESFESFPQENRRDRELVRFFREQGVPAEQIVYLQDRAATTRRIQNELRSLLSKTQEGDTLFLYYTGHGFKSESGRAYFASYDANDDDNPGWAVDSIPATVERYFKGSSAFLTADCCFSGALADSVRARRSRISYAVYTSATSDNISTGNWTFTEALLAGLRGRSYIDTDGNGEITFIELGREIKSDMSFAEQQTASFFLTGKFGPQTILAGAQARADQRIGARVEVYSEGDWYKARIIDAGRGRYRVHYYGYEDSDDEWVKPSQIRSKRITRAELN
ncbi:MAG TPA: agenet domain-containing protein [Pyrinomonadaceae bacterium]|nr:agenet domain-containing protein [Pyrinomonadaceae bacterium]